MLFTPSRACVAVANVERQKQVAVLESVQVEAKNLDSFLPWPTQLQPWHDRMSAQV